MGLFGKKTTSSASNPVEPAQRINVEPEDAAVVPSLSVSEADSLEKSRDLETTMVDEKGPEANQKIQDASPVANHNADSSQGTAYLPSEKEGKTQEDVQVESDTKSTSSVSVVGPAGPGDDDEVVYPGGVKLALICLALCLSVFLVALDNTIIATAIPKITDHFKSLGDVGWYGSSYLLTTCALQLFFGKLYTFYSIKTVYLVSIVIFEVGSAVCGGAPTSDALIVGRAIAGVGSAGIFSGALVIIAYTVPLKKRPIYTGIIGAMYGIASIAGPLLGGAFTDGPGWRWCFYINLPLGGVTLVVIFIYFHSPVRKAEQKVPLRERAHQLDLGGTALFIIAIVVCLLALQWGGSTYAWSNWRIILCLTLFGVLTIVFVIHQYFMKEYGTIPFNIISQRSVASACWFSFTLGASFFVLIYWVPIWFQAIKGASAFKSGIMCLPMVLALVLANIATGVGTTAIGYYAPFYFGCVVLSAIGSGLLTTFETTTGHEKWIGYQVIYGFGVGLGMQQALITVQTVLPLKDVPTGTAMVMFMQTFGGALFVSVAQNIFNNRLMSEIPKLAPGIDPAIILHVGATSLKEQIPKAALAGVQTAYNTSLTQTWYIAVAMTCLQLIGAVFVEWKSVRGMQPGGIAA
ncbi:hypothetical protein Z517_02179 [Fonsecaea pedrosoi CBS 271.37]|uniref:Unplaced genomic scaffold supercont1.2, whole genome shotgun sequence n=1 Tax=Fonsecaea pedrosoi CBS 271.37 TaxID=1442368 RepID=A0A0D2DYU5_9EURO|nr:uncharacterized protein Z517_02179 [Fonsecaea pedrosoi CBS 271.37]KIW82936.1 hypothetical protein Z517_02179 [Fonsecaea pedrosoi CBS 271.37]